MHNKYYSCILIIGQISCSGIPANCKSQTLLLSKPIYSRGMCSNLNVKENKFREVLEWTSLYACINYFIVYIITPTYSFYYIIQ